MKEHPLPWKPAYSSLTVLSMAVAPWWGLLVPLLGLDGGTGTSHHTYQRRKLQRLLMFLH